MYTHYNVLPLFSPRELKKLTSHNIVKRKLFLNVQKGKEKIYRKSLESKENYQSVFHLLEDIRFFIYQPIEWVKEKIEINFLSYHMRWWLRRIVEKGRRKYNIMFAFWEHTFQDLYSINISEMINTIHKYLQLVVSVVVV